MKSEATFQGYLSPDIHNCQEFITFCDLIQSAKSAEKFGCCWLFGKQEAIAKNSDRSKNPSNVYV
jgi:hypothetical protein